MNIAIIGAGHVGGTLAKHLTEAGHNVAIANSRGPDTLRRMESQLGDHGRAVTAEQAAAFGDVVFVSVPFGHYTELPVAGTAGKTVVDTSNYDPDRDGHIADLDDDRTTSSELLQRHLPQATVVKAFNTMRWDHLRDYGRTGGSLTRYGMPVSGDDAHAKREVEDLVEQLGFAPVDAGDLAHGGRRQQPGSPVFTADLTADDMHARLDPEVSAPTSQDWTDAAARARTSDDPRARTPRDPSGIPTTGTTPGRQR
ncbi:NADPH-dependent F420 reductase [Phytohabitans sp. ZYX-F-186]|uniref:NADPH-dependent F420 reductase n=1 Tax=Phytohabitans maris TaxID=3071409 RepID=A0ABU0ZAE9_9ACTN|nr:NADPH-dependent F420 reductase [Phytohabitans sp. ZYX-F-186]MDQ7904032.1 NADPH-dependent F420 reductase [Phytohabitans sp. ZYX-F-186]